MANIIMPAYRRAEMTGLALDLADPATALVLVAVDADQEAADDAMEFLADIAAGARISTTGALQNKVVTADGRLTCDPIELPDTGGANTPEHVYLVHNTGDPATSRILVRWDTGIGGFPLTPDNVNDMIQAATANGLFRL